MKTLKFNTNSWHYYLADNYSSFNPHDNPNLCAYMRGVAIGLVKVTFFVCLLTLLAAGISWLFWNVAFGVYFSIVMHTYFFTDEGTAVLILAGVALVGYALYKGVHLLFEGISKASEKVEASVQENPDSFIGSAWNAWHNKFCARLDFGFDSKKLMDNPESTY